MERAGARAHGRWVATTLLAFDQLIVWGILYYAFSVLSEAAAVDLNVSARACAGAFSASLLIAGLLAPRVGRRLDAHGSKLVLVGGSVLAALVVLAIAWVERPIVAFALFLALGAAQALCLYEPAFRTVVGWFSQPRSRARALLVVTSVGGLASTAILPLTAVLNAHFGWRHTLLVFAATLLLVITPLRLALPDSKPEPKVARANHGRAVHPRSLTLVGGAFAISAFASTGVMIYMVWFLVERGHSVQYAAVTAGIVGAAKVPGRLALGLVKQWTNAYARLPWILLVQALSLGLTVSGSEPLTFVGVLGFGGASGMLTLERPALLSRWYGSSQFGAHNGKVVGLATIAKAAAPLIVATAHDFVSYRLIFASLAVLLVVGAIISRHAAQVRRAETERG